MKEILEKISSYNFFNYLLPGILFSYLLNELTTINIIQKDIIIGLFIYYFVGMIISRIGSIIIEPIFKKTKIISFSDYTDFVIYSKKDTKIELFSEVNNTYRTITSGAFTLLIIKLSIWVFDLLSLNISLQKIIGVIAILILFGFSYRKQTNYISKRIEAIKNNNGT